MSGPYTYFGLVLKWLAIVLVGMLGLTLGPELGFSSGVGKDDELGLPLK